MATSGYIYVLANPSTKGIVKVGKTRKHPEERARALSSVPGVATPFVVVYQAYFENYEQAEQFVHKQLGEFRVASNREFFQVAIPTAVDALIEAKKYFGNLAASSNLTKDENMECSDNADSSSFETIQDSERVLYHLLDRFLSRSVHGWNRYLRSIGLSMPQFAILMQLYYHGAFSISEISDRFSISVPAASQLVEKLVQAGYLERIEDPNDRRAKLIPLSVKGKRIIEEGFQKRYRWLDKILKNLAPQEKAKVKDALAILAEAAREMETEPVPAVD